MKLVNLDTKILDLNGDEIKLDKKAEEGETVKSVIANIVAAGFEKATPLEAARLYNAAKEIHDAGDEFTVDTGVVDLIKRSCDANRAGFTPFVLGQVLLLSGLEDEKSIDTAKGSASKKKDATM